MVATLSGLALDGLDDHDAHAVVAGLCLDLVVDDPGAAVRARLRAILANPHGLHDPEAASAAYLTSAAILQLCRAGRGSEVDRPA